MMRKYVKLVALLLLVGTPVLGLLALLFAVIVAPPSNFEELGRGLDVAFDKVWLPVLGGAVLWQLLRIEERLQSPARGERS
jgi:hypothetical protein